MSIDSFLLRVSPIAENSIDLAKAREQALEEIRKQYPPLLTSAHVAELMQCTIGEVRDQVHRGDLPAAKWGQQFRIFREEVLAVLLNRPAGLDAEAE